MGMTRAAGVMKLILCKHRLQEQPTITGNLQARAVHAAQHLADDLPVL